MVNAANITRLGSGKPVIISNKLPGNVTNPIRTNVGTAKMTTVSSSSPGTSSTTTTTNLVIGGQTVKVPSSLNLNSAGVRQGTATSTTTQHVMIGNQLVKIQSSSNTGGDQRGKPVILNTNTGQTFKVQSLQMQGNQGKIIKVRMGN